MFILKKEKQGRLKSPVFCFMCGYCSVKVFEYQAFIGIVGNAERGLIDFGYGYFIHEKVPFNILQNFVLFDCINMNVHATSLPACLSDHL